MALPSWIKWDAQLGHYTLHSDNLEDPETFCNPIIWLDECEEGLKKWAEEID